MKRLLSIILLAAALAAAPAAGQTIKSLGFNTTNGQIVANTGTNVLTFTNRIKVGALSEFTRIAAFDSPDAAGINLVDQYIEDTNGPFGIGAEYGIGSFNMYVPITFYSNSIAAATRTNLGGTTVGNAVFTATNAAAARTAIGATTTGSDLLTTASAAAGRGVLGGTSFGGAIFAGSSASAKPTLIASILGFATTNSLGFDSSLTNLWTATNAASAATAIGLGATDSVTFSNVTATGNATLNGSGNLAPSQTASSGSSLMTRELSDFRLFGQLALLDQIRSDMGTVHSTNGGGGAIDVNGFDLTTSTNSASSSLYRGYFGSKQTLSGTGGNTVWQGRVVAAWSFNRFNTNVEVRMQFGRNASVTNHGPLDERGMGIRVNGNNMFFETHDGTTLFETTNAVALTHNFGPDVFWAVSESGVARFYRGESTLLATVTNNVPTTFAAGTQRWVISISNTSTVSSGFRVRANPGYILQQ
jgi:hypothetical protein